MSLRRELKKFRKWAGIWTGVNKLPNGKPGWLRMEIKERLGGELLEISADSISQETLEFAIGGVSMLGIGPNSSVQMLSYSTAYGALVLDEVPDDPGVLSLSGTAASGLNLTVTMVVDNDEMLMTTIVRMPGEDKPSSRTATRLRQWKPLNADEPTPPPKRTR